MCVVGVGGCVENQSIYGAKVWFVNFDKTYSRGGRLNSQRIKGIGAVILIR